MLCNCIQSISLIAIPVIVVRVGVTAMVAFCRRKCHVSTVLLWTCDGYNGLKFMHRLRPQSTQPHRSFICRTLNIYCCRRHCHVFTADMTAVTY